MASTEFGVCKSFRYEIPATLRRFHKVFAALADGKAVISLLSCYEEHPLGFFLIRVLSDIELTLQSQSV